MGMQPPKGVRPAIAGRIARQPGGEKGGCGDRQIRALQPRQSGATLPRTAGRFAGDISRGRQAVSTVPMESLIEAEITDPRLKALFGYWNGKRAGRAFPSRRDIDPLEMSPWLGNLLLLACEPGPSYRYVLYGTRFVEAFGVDLTGQSIDSLPSAQHRMLAEEYDTARMSGVADVRRYTASFGLRAAGIAVPGEQEMTWERLVLPLGGTRSSGTREGDLDRVALLLVGAYPLGAPAS
jgi:hypothetical protein